MSSLVTELCFADDAVITASTREDITKATVELQQVTAECGLTISFPKTKLMVAGRGIIESDVAPLCIGSSVVDTVPSFRYLGSVVESHGGVMLDLDDKIARASRAFGALQKPVFRDGSLSLVTKKVVYQAVVLGVLLYAAETWPAKQRDIRRLEGFHHRCLRSILGIGRMQQRLQHISNEKMRQWFGMPTSLEVTIACRRLQWLGHVARMEDSRLPKQFLFGWLSHPRPAHGVKLRWRDKVRRDLKTFHINENTWYALACGVGCSNTPGEPHRCHCNCTITCWCVVCAQDPSGDHRIWQDTTVTVFVVALQQLGMFDEFSTYPSLRGERYWSYLNCITQSAFQQKDVTLGCSSFQGFKVQGVCVCMVTYFCVHICVSEYGWCNCVCVCIHVCVGVMCYMFSVIDVFLSC